MKIYILGVLLILYPKLSDALEVTLSWDANTDKDLAYYTLYQADALNGKTGPWSAVKTIPETLISTTVIVEDGKNFAWYLTASDASGNTSGASNTVSLYDKIAPHAPINLSKDIGETQP